jgi:hypothetical protein
MLRKFSRIGQKEARKKGSSSYSFFAATHRKSAALFGSYLEAQEKMFHSMISAQENNQISMPVSSSPCLVVVKNFHRRELISKDPIASQAHRPTSHTRE